MIQAVLFDWRGTLVVDPLDEWWFCRAAERLGQRLGQRDLERLSSRLTEAANRPELASRLSRADCSSELHRGTYLDLFQQAGMDEEFARTLYDLDFAADSHPFFADAATLLSRLHEVGVRIAVVSDIHFDVRPEFLAADLGGFVDAYVLSFEHGMQKPDPAFFHEALDQLGVAAAEALMVGDNPVRDGGAAAIGVSTLILPPLREPVSRGLDLVLRLVDK